MNIVLFRGRNVVLNSHLIFVMKQKPKTFIRASKVLLCLVFLSIFAWAFPTDHFFQTQDKKDAMMIPQVEPLIQMNQLSSGLNKRIRNAELDFPSYEYQIKLGDNLLNIFQRLSIPYTDLRDILAADSQQLKVNTLQIGHILRFWMGREGQKLRKFEIEFNMLSKIQYVRNARGQFEYQKIKLKGQTRRSVIIGRVQGNFATSAVRSGLTYAEVDKISELLRYQINFSQDLHAGDRFTIVRTEQFIHQKPTGMREIQAIKIEQANREISAYLHDNGHYYSASGRSLSQTFLRYPTKHKPRITSHYNMRRLHPVTRKIKPHLGTDFAAQSGSEVIATSDGIVSLVRNHQFAGKYLVIEHSEEYKTRYMHNSRILVKPGERVKKGQVIALAGATGRVTGPHIHYELLVNGRAVDPMQAYLPTAAQVALKDKYKFNQRVADLNRFMAVAQQHADIEF